MILILALGALALLLPIVAADLLRGGTIRRIALRNVARRKGEAALVVGGSMLATALITGSLVVGTSFEQSIRAIAETTWGPADELVITEDLDSANRLAAGLERNTSGEIDGTLPLLFADVAVGGPAGDARRVEPSAQLFEVDVERAGGFGGQPELTGLSGVTAPGPAEAVINQRLADELGVSTGATVEVFAGTEGRVLDVIDVVPATGLAGFADIVVSPGTFSDAVIAAGGDVESVAGSGVLVSNTGGVYDGVNRTDTVSSIIDDVAAAELGSAELVDTNAVKRELLADADAEGAEMTELFGTVGGFSVIAGILLVINLFVMLAGERQTELGTMRAVGLKRGHLLRSFMMEGAVYGVIAAIVGALLGVVVGAGVIGVASNIFASDGDDFTVSLGLDAVDLLTGAVIGLAISQLTVAFTSIRLTKVNIIRALKDLPEPAGTPHSTRRLVVGLIGLAGAAALFVLASTTPVVALLAPVVGLISLIPVVGRFLPATGLARRVSTVALCGVALAWAASVFGVLPETMADPGIELFLLQGVLLVGLATTMVASLDAVWLAAAKRLGGGGIGVRLGLAHPLSRPVRSALLVAMYALVLFTVTFMSVMNSVFTAAAPDLAAQASGSYDVVVDSNPVAPIRLDQVQSEPGVESAVVVTRTGAEFRSPGSEDVEGWSVTVLSENVDPARMPALDERAAGFTSDSEAWAAIASPGPGQDWIIVPEYSDFIVGDEVEVLAAEGGSTLATVAGTTRNNWLIGAGIYLSPAVGTTLEPSTPSRVLVSTSDAQAGEALAASLTGSLPEQGVDARTVLSDAQVEMKEQEGFLRLLSGYLGLGLLIGIAGLSVVLVRAVRERRRQLGMLNAIGVPAGQSRRAFVVEAAFIGLQGVLLGVGMGLLSSWQTLTRSSAFEEGLTFSVPFVELLALGAVALAASLIAAIGPARRAGNTPPAVALRITG